MMSRFLNRASIAFVTNLLNLLLFLLILPAGILNIVKGPKNFAYITTNVYICLLAIFLFVTEIVCFKKVIQQCQFIYSHRGRGFTYFYLGCLIYPQDSLYHQFAGIYCMTIACLLLVLSFIKQFPGRCELKISLRWMRGGLSGLEPELKDTDEYNSRINSPQLERAGEVDDTSNQKTYVQTQQVSPDTAALTNSVVYPNHVYQPTPRVKESNPNPNFITPRTLCYSGASVSTENAANKIVRYPRPSYPPSYVERNLALNASPWNTVHPSQYPCSSPNRWRYNPSIRTFAPMNGSPYYLPTQPQVSTQQYPNLQPSTMSTPRKVTFPAEDATQLDARDNSNDTTANS